MSRALMVCLWFSVGAMVVAQTNLATAAIPPCPLDTTNPVITHTPIPLHGSLQGKTVYNSPSEWPFVSFQKQWAPSTLDLANPMLGHVHMEVCYPYLGHITGPITIPFRIQGFMLDGRFGGATGSLVRNIVFDGPAVPLNNALVLTGHLTLDPFLPGDGLPPIHSATPNGWTHFEVSAGATLTNGDQFTATAFLSLYTVTNPAAPETAGLWPIFEVRGSVSSARDPQINQWGDHINGVPGWPLPLVAPFTDVWTMPSMLGYSYGGNAALANGTFEIRKDMNQHLGLAGTHLDMFGEFDPAKIGPCAPCKLAMIWTTSSGPDGIPGVAAPNETLASLVVVTIDTSGSVPPPPPPTCTPPAVLENGVCVVPPPPVPSWSLDGNVGLLSFWHQGEAVRVCTSDKCLVLGTATLTP